MIFEIYSNDNGFEETDRLSAYDIDGYCDYEFEIYCDYANICGNAFVSGVMSCGEFISQGDDDLDMPYSHLLKKEEIKEICSSAYQELDSISIERVARLTLSIENPGLFQELGIEDIASYEDGSLMSFGNGYSNKLTIVKKTNNSVTIEGNILDCVSLLLFLDEGDFFIK